MIVCCYIQFVPEVVCSVSARRSRDVRKCRFYMRKVAERAEDNGRILSPNVLKRPILNIEKGLKRTYFFYYYTKDNKRLVREK